MYRCGRPACGAVIFPVEVVMPKVYAMMANGTEEVECLAVVDVLRRAGAEVTLVSIENDSAVTSSHGVRITADATVNDVELTDCDALFLPGGMPGSTALAECKPLIAAIGRLLEDGKRVAAICAAPSVVLGANGFLRGKRAVCFPGFEGGMAGASVQAGARVVTDGNITTARGLGCAIELGLELVALLFDRELADALAVKIQF